MKFVGIKARCKYPHSTVLRTVVCGAALTCQLLLLRLPLLTLGGLPPSCGREEQRRDIIIPPRPDRRTQPPPRRRHTILGASRPFTFHDPLFVPGAGALLRKNEVLLKWAKRERERRKEGVSRATFIELGNGLNE